MPPIAFNHFKQSEKSLNPRARTSRRTRKTQPKESVSLNTSLWSRPSHNKEKSCEQERTSHLTLVGGLPTVNLTITIKGTNKMENVPDEHG